MLDWLDIIWELLGVIDEILKTCEVIGAFEDLSD